MKRGPRLALVTAAALAALAGAVAAEPKAEPKIQVLQADGPADAKVRAKIDAALLALAKSSGVSVIPGDITFTDAATAVGCRASDAACKDEVLGMLSVDEIIVTTVTPKPGGFEVAVRRIGKGGAAREAINFVAFDRVDRLDTLAPLFSTKLASPASGPGPGPVTSVPFGPSPAPTTEPTPTTPTSPTSPTSPASPASPPGAVTTRPAPPAELPSSGAQRGGPPAASAPAASPIETRPDPYAAGRDDRPSHQRLPLAGMVGGGGMVLVGLVLWGSAASVQSEIDAAPDSTKEQLRALQDLESRGDGYATAGNLFVTGGLIVGGISTYYFLKRGRGRTTAARRVPVLVPVVVGGGGGIAFTFGGTP